MKNLGTKDNSTAVGTKVVIVSGELRGTSAIIINAQKEEIGDDMMYKLKDINGNKLYNGSFSFFPESFITY